MAAWEFVGHSTVTTVLNGGVVAPFPASTSMTRGQNLVGVASSSSLIVALADTGTLMTSSDGFTWTVRPSGLRNAEAVCRAIACSGSTFAISSCYGRGSTSPDGISWTPNTITGTPTYYFICYGGSKFVQGTSGGIISTSSDGATWTDVATGLSSVTWVGGTYGGGKFVVVGGLGIAYSTDAVSWTTVTMGSGNRNAVAYGAGVYIAVGSTGLIETSPDGATWTAQTSGTTVALYGIAYGAGLFVAVGLSGTILTSPDGVTWTTRTSYSSTRTINAIAFTGSVFVAVGALGTSFVSSDGITWTAYCSVNNAPGTSICYTGSRYIAGGNSGLCMKSSDGEEWQLLNGPFYSQSSVSFRYALSKLYALCPTGVLYYSDNHGDTWTAGASGVTANLSDMATDGTVAVMVTTAGGVLTSTDGTTWTSRTSGTTNVNRVAYGNSLFVAFGAAGTIITSPDGITWTTRTSGTTNQLNRCVWNGSIFVIVGTVGTIITSPDGITWTTRTSGTTLSLNGLAWGNSMFVAAGSISATTSGGIVTHLTSADGITWTTRYGLSAGNPVMDLTYGGSKFIALTANGGLFRGVSGLGFYLNYLKNGDLLVAMIAARGSAPFTIPSGWALCGTQQSSGNTLGTTSGVGSGLMAYQIIDDSVDIDYLFARTAGDVGYARSAIYRAI